MNRDKINYNNMIYKKLSLSVLLFAAGFLTASAQKSPQDMDRFIDVLMNKMTLEEKIRLHFRSQIFLYPGCTPAWHTRNQDGRWSARHT